MGYEIIAVSKARRVACSGGDECEDTHWPVGHSSMNRDGLKQGCYVTGRGGKDTSFSISYISYPAWADELSILALGVSRDEVLQHARRYRGKPFVELFAFPDTDNAAIGPKTAAKLHADFVAFATKARRHFLGRGPSTAGLTAKGQKTELTDEDTSWMWDVYRELRRAFRLASNDGLVTFC